MYSSVFVVNAAKAVEVDKNVTGLVLEDLIQRNDEPISETIIDLLADNFFCSVKKSSPGRNCSKRIWTSIVFVDCISDADSYKEYLDLKQSFLSSMKERLASKGMTKALPMTFEAKIELHTMLDVYGVIQLLEAVIRDSSVKSVKFTGFHGEDEEIAQAFGQLVDVESMKWKETVEILVRYGRRGAKKGQDNQSATALVAECAKVLKRMVFSGPDSDDFDDTSCMPSSAFIPSVRKPGMDDESETEVSLFESSQSLRVRAASP
jgi:hypothetical protein